MNITELSDAVAERTGLDKKSARGAVDAVVETIIKAASAGEEVGLFGFGKFSVTARDARQGRNPSTGETIQIAASKKLGFTAAKQVKTALNPAPVAPPAKAASKASKGASKPAATPMPKRASAKRG